VNSETLRSVTQADAPLYLVEFLTLNTSSENIYADYIDTIRPLIQAAGGEIMFTNSAIQALVNDDDIDWEQAIGLYFPSGVAYYQFLSTPEFADAILLKQEAVEEQLTLVTNSLTQRGPIDRFPEKEEFYMLNLFKYADQANYPDGDRGLTGEQANNMYTSLAVPILGSVGAYGLFVAEVDQVLFGNSKGWDRFALARYPSFEDLSAMISTQEMQDALVHKNAALSLNISIASAANQETDFIISPARTPATENYRTNFEVRLPTGENVFSRHVYLCEECSPEEFTALEVPSPYQKSEARVHVASTAELVSSINPGEVEASLSFSDDIPGNEWEYIAKVLSWQIVSLAPLLPIAQVARDTRFVYNAGTVIHELVNDDDERYILFTITIELADAIDLSQVGSMNHLYLPEGWSYESRRLSEDLVVNSDGQANVVPLEGTSWQRYQ